MSQKEERALQRSSQHFVYVQCNRVRPKMIQKSANSYIYSAGDDIFMSMWKSTCLFRAEGACVCWRREHRIPKQRRRETTCCTLRICRLSTGCCRKPQKPLYHWLPEPSATRDPGSVNNQ